MVGEGLARAIAIGSIVLTAASLATAFSLARRRTRIRVGFDVARAVVGFGAVVVVGFLAVLITFLGNFVFSGLHAYN